MIDPAQLSTWLWVVAPLVIVLAYVIFGLSGFGSTILAVPLLAHFLPVTFLVPMMVLLDITASIVVGTRGREQVAASELKWIIPCMFVGIVLGVTLLVKVPQDWLRTALGVFATAVGVHSVLNPVLHRTISRWWSVPAGLIGGAIASVFGAGGPIYATYLSGRLRDKGEIRATISSLIAVSAFSRAVVYAITGLLLHAVMLVAVAVLAPFVVLGLKLGNRIHIGLTQVQMRRAIGFVLIASGVSLLARVFL